METGDNIQELSVTLTELFKKMAKVQTAWATVKTVDWDAKTMVATGIVDELDYHDVKLGVGNRYYKPEVGSKCLIGLIENMDAAAFLIEAEDVAETVVTHGDSKLTINKSGFKMERNGESLKALLNDTLQAIISSTYTNGGGTTSPPNNMSAFQSIKNRVPNLLL